MIEAVESEKVKITGNLRLSSSSKFKCTSLQTITDENYELLQVKLHSAISASAHAPFIRISSAVYSVFTAKLEGEPNKPRDAATISNFV